MNNVGMTATARGIWQRIMRRRAVMVSTGAPARLGRVQRLMLSWLPGAPGSREGDAELEQTDIGPGRMEKTDCADGQSSREQSGAAYSSFAACPRTRGQIEAHHIIYVGELSPRSGVADFQACAIAWAERHPQRALHISWLGSGDLQGVLYAQVAPPNLHQLFAAAPPHGELADTFAQCGMLVVPCVANARAPIAEAMAAGLPVLGSTRSAMVRRLVTSHETGWLFDPLSPEQMATALDAALATIPEQLDVMRAAAGARIKPEQADWGGNVDVPRRTNRRGMMAGSAPVQA